MRKVAKVPNFESVKCPNASNLLFGHMCSMVLQTLCYCKGMYVGQLSCVDVLSRCKYVRNCSVTNSSVRRFDREGLRQVQTSVPDTK